MSARVRIVDVGPRDGLQNEPRPVALALKARFVRELFGAGLREVEAGAFVRPDLVPQMADSDRLFRRLRDLRRLPGARLWALVPNRRGLERAQAAGVREIAVFVAATEGFNRANLGDSVAGTLAEIREVAREARAARLPVRGYVSTAFGCPFDGPTAPARARRAIDALADIPGVLEVSIGDTIGVATPRDVERVLGPALLDHGADRLAVHFHDTRGTALANSLRAFELGVRAIDASAGGLGGCPFAPGATGNLATEDLVYALDGMGARTGVNLEKLARASLRLARAMRRPLTSRYLLAFAAGRGRSRAEARGPGRS